MIKYVNDSIKLSRGEVSQLLMKMIKFGIGYMILTANYCRARDLRGSKEWIALHDKKGHNKKKCQTCSALTKEDHQYD